MKINRRIKKIILVIIGLCILSYVSFLHDTTLLKATIILRTPELSQIMRAITSYEFLFGVPAVLFLVNVHRWKRWFFVLGPSLIVAIGLGETIKLIIKRPRPLEFFLDPAVQQSSFAFPSLHSTIAFTIFIYLARSFPRQKIIWFLIAASIAFSRVYIGVHHFSDIFAGAALGITIGEIFLLLERRYHYPSRVLPILHEHLEIRRRIFHMLTGIGFTYLIYKSLWVVQSNVLIILTGIVGGFTLITQRGYRIPILYDILTYFERGADLKHFPGKGVFFFLLGAGLTGLLFGREILIPSLMILAVADPISGIIGGFFGRIPDPFHPQKKLEGTIAGIIGGTLVASMFTPMIVAFLASSCAMLIESLPLRLGKWRIDDNLTIPLVAGLVIYLLT